MAEIFPDKPLCAFRRDKNLRDQLVRAKVRDTVQPSGTFACGKSRCNTCKFVCPSVKIKGPSGTHTVLDTFTCTTRGVVYAIRCRLCDLLYVGQTGQRLADRFAQHLRSIRRDDGQPVSRHFNTPRHGGATVDLELCGLALVTTSAPRRITVESMLIHKLGTLVPSGLNTRLDVCVV